MKVKPKNGAPERRFFHATELRVEDREGGDGPVLRGYAAVFEQLSEKMFWFREKIQHGAFAQSIGEDDIRALFNHDTGLVLGRNRSKTLELWEDSTGLGFQIQPPPTALVRDLVLTPIDRGDISHMSFGFITRKDAWNYGEDGEEEIRTLVDVKLMEVSPVTFPAYTQTSVSARSLRGVGLTLDELADAHEAALAGVASTEQLEFLRRTKDSLDHLLPVPARPSAASPMLGLRRRRLELGARLMRKR